MAASSLRGTHETTVEGFHFRGGKQGAKRPPNKTRDKRLELAMSLGHVTSQKFKEVTYKDLADQVDFEQLEMLLDHVRVRYLLANVNDPNFENKPLLEILGWIFELADSKAEKSLREKEPSPAVPPAPPPSKPPAASDPWAQLRATAFATMYNLRDWPPLNIFGEAAKFVTLGDLESYKIDLNQMLALYAPVENAYKQLNADLVASQERDTYLSNVSLRQGSLIRALENALVDAKKNLENTLKEIKKLDATKDHAEKAYTKALSDLEKEIGRATGVTPGDVFNALTQLSFTNTHFVTPQGALDPTAPLAAGAMIISQIGDLITKAADNVVTDTGGSINKNLVIRRMEFLSKDVGTMTALKETRDGLLKTDPKAEYRLLATREQVEAILSNFYKTYPDAKKVSGYLDQYIEAVVARNEKVEEYNQFLSQFVYIASELLRTKMQKQLTDTAHQHAASPGLPTMAKFSRALRRHAWEDCVQILYRASRVFALKSLDDSYDVFSTVLGRLASGSDPAELDSAALNTALIDIITKDLTTHLMAKTTSQDFKPDGSHCCLTLKRKPAAAASEFDPFLTPAIFESLKSGEYTTFRILAPDRDATVDENPFAGMADVRLTHITCTPTEVKTKDTVFTIELTHSGAETFIDEKGREVHLIHNPVTLSLTGKDSAEVALDKDHTLIGPFCEWTIKIPKNADLTKLESITFGFKGTYRSFVLDTKET